MPYRRYLAAIGLCAAMSVAHADDFDRLGQPGVMSQDAFRLLSEDLGAVTGYRAVSPPTPLGITGFDIGIEATATQLSHPEAYEQATGDADSTVYVPRLHVHKGLPLGLDVAGSYAKLPGSPVKLVGAELRYALISGGLVKPTVGLRVSYSALKGSDYIEVSNRAIDLSISKGFPVVTPYAGIGNAWTTSTPNRASGLREESFSQVRYFVGANFKLLLLDLALEADRTGSANSYSAKFGIRW